MSTLTALKYCGVLVLYTLAAGVGYDFYAAWQKWHKKGKVSYFLGDMLVLTIFGAGLVWVIVDLGGVVRFYVFLAVFCGMLGYMAVLHKIVFRIFWQVLKWGSAVTERVMLPWRRLGQRIRKKIKKNLKNFRKTSGNSTENDI